MEGWPYSFTVPVAMASDDPADLTERIADKLVAGGFVTDDQSRPSVALSAVRPDGTRLVYINTTADPSALLFGGLTDDTESAEHKRKRLLAARLKDYVNTPNPTGAQTVAALKDTIRALGEVWSEVRNGT